MICLELPWPPSVNHYWKEVGRGRKVIDKPGLIYRTAVRVALLQKKVKRLDGDLIITIWACPPDLRRRDQDNIEKCLFDALQHGGLYKDDYQVACHLNRRPDRIEVVKGGRLYVNIYKRGDSADMALIGNENLWGCSTTTSQN